MKARSALLFLFAILSLGLSVASAQENIFTVRQPDYQKSPYTGTGQTHYIFYYILLFYFFAILLIINALPFVYIDYFSYLYKIY